MHRWRRPLLLKLREDFSLRVSRCVKKAAFRGDIVIGNVSRAFILANLTGFEVGQDLVPMPLDFLNSLEAAVRRVEQHLWLPE